jgi:lipocalin
MTTTVQEQSSLRHLDVWLDVTARYRQHAEATISTDDRCTGQKIGNKVSQLSSTNLVTATSTLNSYPSVTVGQGGVA